MAKTKTKPRRKNKPSKMATNKTANKKALFLERLKVVGVVTKACTAARINKATAYRWRTEDAKFLETWDSQMNSAAKILEDTMYQRGLKGDNTAAIFWLKGHARVKYCQRVEHTGENGRPIEYHFINVEDPGRRRAYQELIRSGPLPSDRPNKPRGNGNGRKRR